VRETGYTAKPLIDVWRPQGARDRCGNTPLLCGYVVYIRHATLEDRAEQTAEPVKPLLNTAVHN
jgi:hypothetical protein